MTTAVTEFFDAIGQKITPGDFVISIRDGTGAKPRMALKFSPSKVSVSSSWGNSQSYMDDCSLVVITSNLKTLKDAGDQAAEQTMNDLMTTFSGMIVHASATPKPPALRLLAVSYNTDGMWGSAGSQYISVHEVKGTTEAAAGEGYEEAAVLARTVGLQVAYTMVRSSIGLGYRSDRSGEHWDYGRVSTKETLFPLKAASEIGLSNVELNKLIPVATFNSMVPPTHRIKEA